jgi:Fe-S oxidoreductase
MENMTQTKKTVKISKVAQKNKATDKKNVENVQKKITTEKELMYQYPSDIDTLPLRKSFRRKARATRDSFKKKIAKAENKTQAAALIKEAKAWAESVFTKGNVPVFS